MIKLVRHGDYTLFETKNVTKILVLDHRNTFAWVDVEEIGEILVTAKKLHQVLNLLAMGKYRLYEVKNEEGLVDVLHLELSIGKGLWQGYLLPIGLPTSKDKKHRIIPTKEIITKSSYHAMGSYLY